MHGEEPETLIEAVDNLCEAIRSAGGAVTDPGAGPSPCPSGDGQVGCLTEAAMGMTRALVNIGHAIESLAEAVRDLAPAAED